MAIPEWTWPDDSSGAARSRSGVGLLDGSRTEDPTDVFELLSDATRLEILASLYGRPDPVSYTDLRAATSVDDNGRLNYHLRRLEPLLRSEGGEYALTRRGRALVRAVVPRDRIRQHEP